MLRMAHKCMATGCPEIVQAVLFMCPKHWARVPEETKAAIWKAYRPGQEQDLKLSDAYVDAAMKAISEVGT